MNTPANQQKVTDHSQNRTPTTEVNPLRKLNEQPTVMFAVQRKGTAHGLGYKQFGAQPSPPKEDHYAAKQAASGKQGKHNKTRKYLAKELRFKPNLEFAEATGQHDKHTIKQLDKTIRGLAIKDVFKACDFTKQAYDTEWRDTDSIPKTGNVPPEFLYMMGEFYKDTGSEMAHALADYLESPLHFWLVTIQKFASMPKCYYPYIINDIITRYACLIRTQDMGLIAGYGALVALGSSIGCAFESGKLHLAEHQRGQDEIAANSVSYANMVSKFDSVASAYSLSRLSPDGKAFEAVCPATGEKQIWRVSLQAGDKDADGPFGIFSMLGKLDKILSNGNTKSLITDIIKAISIGALATTALSSGKFSTFTMEGANALIAYTMRKYTDGDSVYAGLFRAATGIYNLIHNWFTCPNGYTFVEFITAVAKVDTNFDLLRELATEESVWASLDAARKNKWCTKFEQLRDFAKLMLGLDNNWKEAKRYLNPRQIDEFRLKFIVLEARHMSDIVTGLRPAPFALVVSGATAQGKTGFTHDLNEFFMQKMGVPRELLGRLIYVMQDNPSDFWDGYQSGTLGIVLDDVCALHSKLSESSGGDKMRRIVAQLLNNQRMLANKAELSQKENTSVRPMWVVANTNVPTLEPGELHRFACIFDRRWNKKIHIQLKPEFATDGGTLCHKAASEDYERRLLIGDESPDDFWEYWVYDMSTTNAMVDGINYENKMPEFEMNTVLKRTHVFKSSSLFYDWLGGEFDKHHRYQAQLVDKMDRAKRFGTVGTLPTLIPQKCAQGDIAPMDSFERNDNAPSAPPWIDADDVVVNEIVPFNASAAKVELVKLVNGKKQGWQSSAKPLALAAALATGTYFAKKTYDYVHDKTTRLEKLLKDAEETSAFVREHQPKVENVLNAANQGIEIVGEIKNTSDATVVYLKKTLACLSAVSALVGVSLLVYRGIRYFTDADIEVVTSGQRQGNMFSYNQKTAVPVHPNDFGAKYEPPMSLGNTNYLTQQSKACQGSNLHNKVWCATRDFVFVSEHTSADGDYKKIHAQGMFVKDKWFVLNHHCLPGVMNNIPEIWGNWTMRIQGSGTNFADAIITKAQFMENAHFYHDTRDMVAVYVQRARDYPDVTKYMADIEGDFADNPIPAGLKIFPIALHCRIAKGEFYGPMPVNCDWGPTGYVTKASAILQDSDGSNMMAIAAVNFISKVGDCGRPYLALRGDLGHEVPYLIYGMHMGVNDDDPIQKLIVPFRKQDFDCLTIPCQLFGDVPTRQLPMNNNFSYQLAESSFLEPADADKAAIWRMIHRCPPMLAKHHMKDETKTWIAGVVADLNGGIFVPTGSARFVGQRVRMKSATFKSKIRKAPLARILFKRNFSHTPFKTFGSGKVIPELTTKQVGIGVAVACSKAYSQPRKQAWSGQLRDHAMLAVKAMLMDVDEDIEKRPHDHVLKQLHKISPEEALNGLLVDEPGVKLKAGEPVNKHSSAGLFWNEKQSPSGAKGKLGYIIRVPGEPDRLHADMQLALDELRALMAKGEYKCMVEAIIKDEPMKPSKLAEGRIRFILVMSMECTLLTREYLFTMCRIMALNPFFFGAMVGIDSSSIQWAQLHDFLRAGEAKLFDGDFQGFEYTLYEELSDALKYYYEQLCIKSMNYDSDDMFTVHNLLANLTNCVVDFFGNVHEFESVNSSGNPLTTQINCTLVKLWVYVVIICQLKEIMGEAFTFEIFREVVKKIVRIASYGDDLLASVILSKKYPDIKILDQIIMQTHLAKFGVTFTDAAKNSVLVSPFPEHYTFLGRSFSQDHKGRCVAKLEEVRIMKPLEFYTEHEQLTYGQLLKSTIRSVLQETYYYGEVAYDDLKEILVDSVCELFSLPEQNIVDTYFSAGSGDNLVPLSYAFFEDWFSAKYDKGAITDVRLDEVINQPSDIAEEVYEQIAMAIAKAKSAQ